MAGWQFVLVDCFHGDCSNEGGLWVDEQVEYGVCSGELVGSDDSDGLFSHLALVGVPGTLVVVWEGNESCDTAENSHLINFEVRGLILDYLWMAMLQGMILLVMM